jgi:hypothetical protein
LTQFTSGGHHALDSFRRVFVAVVMLCGPLAVDASSTPQQDPVLTTSRARIIFGTEVFRVELAKSRAEVADLWIDGEKFASTSDLVMTPSDS